MNKKSVIVGMSGGVDSAVSAYLLKKEGYEVIGITLQVNQGECEMPLQSGTCCSLQDIEDAKRVCSALSIPHYVMNLREVFKDRVISYFVEVYQNARTPNPCIECNRFVKFEELISRAKTIGFSYIATGHYSKIRYDEALKRYQLLRGEDLSKDQSYVLYKLTQEQLSHTLFPLGGYQKEEVRKIAESLALPIAKKKESQEICFIPDNNYVRFVEKAVGEKSRPGNFVDKNGEILGEHSGIIHYTIGQRKGLGITFGKPMFVTGMNSTENTVTLGEHEDLMGKSLIAENVNYISKPAPTEKIPVLAKIRYQAKPAKAVLEPLSEGRIKISFEEPQRAITPGQAVVFYDDRDEDLVLGGGVII